MRIKSWKTNLSFINKTQVNFIQPFGAPRDVLTRSSYTMAGHLPIARAAQPTATQLARLSTGSRPKSAHLGQHCQIWLARALQGVVVHTPFRLSGDMKGVWGCVCSACQTRAQTSRDGPSPSGQLTLPEARKGGIPSP